MFSWQEKSLNFVTESTLLWNFSCFGREISISLQSTMCCIFLLYTTV